MLSENSSSRPNPDREPHDDEAAEGESPIEGSFDEGLSEPGPANGRRLLLRISLLLLALVVVIVAAIVFWAVRRFNDISFVDVPGVEPTAEGAASNWLLVGTDSRDGIDPDSPSASAFLGEAVSGQRADTIMIARVDSASRTIDVLSVPRDLWVPIGGAASVDTESANVAGTEVGRINGADREQLVSTLSSVFEIDINHYAEIDFVGFQEVVDSLGGVAVWFGNPARDERSGLDIAETGCHVLDGAQSLAFARGRTFEEYVDGEWRTDPTGDLGRIARQRIFLFRSIAAAKDQLDLTKLSGLDQALTVGGQNLLIEDGASLRDLLSVARVFAATDKEHFTGHALPVENYRTSGGAQVLRLKEDEADAVLEIFRLGTAPSGPEAQAESDPGSDPDSNPESDSDPDSAGPTVAGAEASADGEPIESSEPALLPMTFPDEPGYGRFGYVAASTPQGTPCG